MTGRNYCPVCDVDGDTPCTTPLGYVMPGYHTARETGTVAREQLAEAAAILSGNLTEDVLNAWNEERRIDSDFDEREKDT